MNTELKEHLRKIGKKGGRKTAKRGKAYYSRIGKLGMESRWAGRKTLSK